jgi:hypothetical protein
MVIDISTESGLSRVCARDFATHHEHMENGHGLRNFLLVVVGLVAVGAIAWWLISSVLGVVFYLIVGAVIGGTAVYLGGKARRAIGSESRRQINR